MGLSITQSCIEVLIFEKITMSGSYFAQSLWLSALQHFTCNAGLLHRESTSDLLLERERIMTLLALAYSGNDAKMADQLFSQVRHELELLAQTGD